MDINWSTFVLEIINFLVLVWLLKRFLYRPVMAAIERRRVAINQGLEEARQMRAEADQLRQQYQNRLQDWQRERQKARDALQQEFDARRAREAKALRETLQQQRQQAEVVQAGERREALRGLQAAALEQGADFAARFLQPLADAALEARLVELALSELAALSEQQRQQLMADSETPPLEIRITSVWPLEEAQRRALESKLATATGLKLPVVFGQDVSLLAGLRIEIGGSVLGANLRDELQAFAHWSDSGD